MGSLQSLPGIGPKTIEKLSGLNINSLTDLAYHFPHRYIDFSHIKKISQLTESEAATISGQIISFNNIYTRHGKNIQKAVVKDDTGQVSLIWFNQPYLAQSIKVGTTLSFAGTVSSYQHHLTIIAPVMGSYQTGKIVAVYPESSQINSGWFRRTIQSHLPFIIADVNDYLPPDILKKFSLLPLKSALTQIHAPTDFQNLEKAILRLSLDEVLVVQARSYMQKSIWQQKISKYSIKYSPSSKTKLNSLIKSLPFKLTSAQESTWKEIVNDLTQTKPMNRLLQGDVGSGKTIISLLAAYLVYLNGASTLLIAPTEILSRQHFATFKKYLPRLPVHLLTGGSHTDLKSIKKPSIIIATHAAIFQKKLLEDQIGLLVVDEQHKFGVEQRSFLMSAISPPHLLTMTATPIPRTISLTLLGHLDLSVLTEPPKNRSKIKTFLVPQTKQSNCYQWLHDHIKKTGEQAFIVCPFIEESETLQSVKAATVEFEELKNKYFSDISVELVHGKIKNEQRNNIFARFQKRETQILITTPIIEVGIDFPNSTCIIILSADRFGLAQLHQLRGRVGRGELQSYCYLYTESENEKALNRLKFLETHHSGQKIAEFDLQSRGPGDAFSTIQHGFPSLKLANLSDFDIINLGQKVLTYILSSHPEIDIQKISSIESALSGYTNSN
jgi:ATP-dependent DNA helicase RecG